MQLPVFGPCVLAAAPFGGPNRVAARSYGKACQRSGRYNRKGQRPWARRSLTDRPVSHVDTLRPASTVLQAERVYQLWAQGSVSEIARPLGIGRTSVSMIR